MPPVRNTMALVYHEQADSLGNLGEDMLAEAVVRQALGRNKKNVDRARSRVASCPPLASPGAGRRWSWDSWRRGGVGLHPVFEVFDPGA